MDRPEDPHVGPRERDAERVAAGAYGTVLVLGALVLLDRDDVADGWGWELVTGVGLATWLAHLYAEVVGDHVRRNAFPGRAGLARAMTDGLPILLAALLPAAVLLLGRLEVLDPGTALRAAVVAAAAQLLGVGLYVGLRVAAHDRGALVLAGLTVVVGAAVVVVEVALGH